MDYGRYFETVHSGSFWRDRGDQPLLYRRRVHYLRSVAPGFNLLDLGAGEGHFGVRAAKYFSVTAVDARQDAVDRCRGRGLSTALASADELPFESEAYDVVTMWDVVEHLKSPEAAFQEVYRCLQVDGLLALSTPNPRALSVRRRGSDSTQFRDPTHISIRSSEVWCRNLEEAGFVIKRVGGDGLWDPPYFRGTGRRVWLGLSQLMFATAACFPFSFLENTVIVAVKANVSRPGYINNK